MQRLTGRWLGLSVFALLLPITPARADDKAQDLPAAPKGFDVRRDDAKRGQLETVEYDSKSVGGKRKMVIYTPPGYSKDNKYPVLYLLHGAGDDETGWQKKGSADVILDNLYADKKLVPMIVVMPNGTVRGPGGGGAAPALAAAIMKRADADKDGKVSLEEFLAAAEAVFKEIDKDKKGKVDEKQLADAIAQLLPRGPGPGTGFISGFEDDLLKDIIPYVDAHFPVKPGSENRAVAGLSMGGGQALGIGLKHLDTFAWVGGFSSAIFGQPGGMTPDAGSARKLRLLWLSCGDRDRLMDASKSFHTALEDKKVPHVWHVDAGAHEWPVWKNDLYLLSQMQFREK